MPESPTETPTCVGLTAGPGGFDGYAGLRIGKRYTGVPQGDGKVAILLSNGRTATVTAEDWAK